MLNKTRIAALLAATLLPGVPASADKPTSAAQVDYTKMTPTELTEYLIFEANGFKLDQPAQEGKTARERMTQDELQKTCSALHGKPADAATAQKVAELARAPPTPIPRAASNSATGRRAGPWPARAPVSVSGPRSMTTPRN